MLVKLTFICIHIFFFICITRCITRSGFEPLNLPLQVALENALAPHLNRGKDKYITRICVKFMSCLANYTGMHLISRQLLISNLLFPFQNKRSPR